VHTNSHYKISRKSVRWEPWRYMLTEGRTLRAYANTTTTVFGISIDQICTRFIVSVVNLNWDRTEGLIHQRHVMISIPNVLSAVDHISLVNRVVQFNVLAPVCEWLSFLETDDSDSEGWQAYCSTVYLLEECCYDDMGYEVHFHTTYIHVTKRYATCSRCFRTLGFLIWV